MNKREFLKDVILFFPAAGMCSALAAQAAGEDPSTTSRTAGTAYDPTDHWYGMGIDIDKCIGCNRCVEACKTENNVPEEPFFFRTWIERYVDPRRRRGARWSASAPRRRSTTRGAGPAGRPDVVRTFFVPKLCNQCAHPPCVQVCPVGATFQTKDGVVLVDEKTLHRVPLLHPGLPVRRPVPQSR